MKQYEIAKRNHLPKTSLIRQKYHPSKQWANGKHAVKLRTKGPNGRLVWTTKDTTQCQCDCVMFNHANHWYSYITNIGAQNHIANFIAEHTT